MLIALLLVGRFCTVFSLVEENFHIKWLWWWSSVVAFFPEVVFFSPTQRSSSHPREPLMMSSKHYNNGIMVWMRGRELCLGDCLRAWEFWGRPPWPSVQVLRPSSALLRVHSLTRFYGVTFRNNINALLLMYSSGEWQSRFGQMGTMNIILAHATRGTCLHNGVWSVSWTMESSSLV